MFQTSPAGLNSKQKPLNPNINEIDSAHPNAANFWYESINNNGQSPFIPNDATWKVFRNVVTDYGADNTGRSDVAKAIVKAINGLPLDLLQIPARFTAPH